MTPIPTLSMRSTLLYFRRRRTAARPFRARNRTSAFPAGHGTGHTIRRPSGKRESLLPVRALRQRRVANSTARSVGSAVLFSDEGSERGDCFEHVAADLVLVDRDVEPVLEGDDEFDDRHRIEFRNAVEELRRGHQGLGAVL